MSDQVGEGKRPCLRAPSLLICTSVMILYI
ncbi:hypothetical protein CsSME_00043377 [Camellia sinensis var. sinensis]